MKSGFKETLDFILKSYGMTNRDAIGTIWSVREAMWLIVQAMGYRVERGINHPTYDYIILSEKKSTLENILLSYAKLNSGGIIVFRHFANTRLPEIMKTLKIPFNAWQYNRGILGVIGKDM
jgi:hypothetical protein